MAHETGRTLLFYAALADEVLVVQHLLKSQNYTLNAVVKKPLRAIELHGPSAPLMVAMSWGSFEVVRALLEAKANAWLRRRDFLQADAFLVACFHSRSEVIKGWLDFFGGTWNIEPKPFGFNATYLIAVATNGLYDESLVVARDLLEAKANTNARSSYGDNCVIMVANRVNDAPALIREFASWSADINSPVAPTRLFRIIMRVARVAVRCGSSRQIFYEFGKRGVGATPLFGAAVQGNVAAMRELLALHADISITNQEGYTALQKAEHRYKAVPPLVRKLLTPQSCRSWS
jgi:hypothetical protein